MRYLLVFILFGIVMAGCSADESTKETAQDNREIPDIAPEGRITEEAGMNETDSSLPLMTADLPHILLTPIQGNATPPSTSNSSSSQNWQTFTSSALGVALDYPLDWSAAEEIDGAIFTSPQGRTILLKGVKTDNESNETRIAHPGPIANPSCYFGMKIDKNP